MEPAQLPLRDIHLPPDISWWPPAIGWWLLAILIPVTIALLYGLYKRIKKNTAVKSAKKQLAQIKQDGQLDNAQKLAQLSMLIRRAAISISGRNECAGLTGQPWLDYLDRSMQGKPFAEGPGQLLVDVVYRNKVPDDQELSQLVDLCENWLNAQRKKKR